MFVMYVFPRHTVASETNRRASVRKLLPPLRLWPIIEHGFGPDVDFLTQHIYNRRSLHYFKRNNPADIINFGRENFM